MFITAPQMTTLETNFLDPSIQGFLWIGCSGRPNTRNAMSSTAPATMRLAAAFTIVSGFIDKHF